MLCLSALVHWLNEPFGQPNITVLLFIYLLIWLHRALVAAGGLFVVLWVIFHCGALLSCGTQAQWW